MHEKPPMKGNPVENGFFGTGALYIVCDIGASASRHLKIATTSWMMGEGYLELDKPCLRELWTGFDGCKHVGIGTEVRLWSYRMSVYAFMSNGSKHTQRIGSLGES